MSATIEDIAVKANVSVSTVSRVLNNVAGKYRISRDTQKLVLKTAKELKYQPNQLARGLRLKKTHTIGLIVPDISNPFFACITDTIQSAAHRVGYSIVVCNTDDKLELEVEHTQLLVSKGVDGLIVLPVGQGSDHFRRLRKENIPFVLVDRYFEDLDAHSVLIDNFKGSYEAVEHLISRGHVRIGLIEGLPGASTTRGRRAGYLAALASHGIPLDESLLRGQSFRKETGYTETKALLRTDNPPTAIFATNDLITLGALEAIYEKGLNIPEDVSLVAFDEIDFNPFLRCPLTTVIQPREEMGEMAVKILVESMAQKEQKVFRQIVLPPRLGEGRSVRFLEHAQSLSLTAT
jgi:LacI family transcriptional regulator